MKVWFPLGLILCLALASCSDDDDDTSDTGNDTDTGGDAAVCGNGTEESGEECDDGNTESGDGCSATCTDEATDDCGNGTIDDGEDCDGEALGDATCITEGHDGGDLACADDCTFDVTACTDEDCGNGDIDGEEDCDGTNLNDTECADLEGFDGGTLTCSDTCTFVTTACEAADPCVAACATLAACLDADGCPAAALAMFNDETAGCPAMCADDPTTITGVAAMGCTTAVPLVYQAAPTLQAACHPTCGNGDLDEGEVCDGTDLNEQTCVTLGFEGTGLACADDCTWDWEACTGAPPNGWTCPAEFYGDETCDCGCGIQDSDCTTLGADECAYCYCPSYSGSDYTGYYDVCDMVILEDDNTACYPCGDDEVNGFESCDGTDMGADTCDTLGFGTGDIACADDCQYDASDCADFPEGWLCDPTWYGDDGCDCGCGIVDIDCPEGATVADCEYCAGDDDYCSNEGGGEFCLELIDPANLGLCLEVECGDDAAMYPEECDGDDLRELTCGSFEGYIDEGSTLACAEDCTFVLDDCTVDPCGNGELEEGELCDTDDLNDETCLTLGFGGGDLACATDCTFDTAACTIPDAWTCSDGYFGGDDGCDCGCGAVDPDCEDETFASCSDYCAWTGSCAEGYDCSVIDPLDNSSCLDNECGDDAALYDEVCDGDDLAGETCLSQGFDGGEGTALTCVAEGETACLAFDTTNCGAETECGSNTITGAEDCDGTAEFTTTCEDLGWGGGTLDCDDTTCTFDTEGCTVPEEWICTSGFGANDGCDCGCGAVDLDCEDATVESCDYCNYYPDMCSYGVGCDVIDPENNAICIEFCGDGIANLEEECDGEDLSEETCITLLHDGGDLSCADDCTFDETACTDE